MLEMEAGRELDVLLAKTVASDEWTDVRRENDGEYGWHIRKGEMLKDSNSNPATSYEPIPYYSTDDEAAQEISARFSLTGLTDSMNGHPPFTCKICGDGDLVFEAKANTRALAICRAAILASGASDENNN